MTTTPRHYIEPTPASARALLSRGIQGEVVMLNLLRFRAIADYAATPELAPGTPISGAEAFARYMTHTLPLLRDSGGDLLFLGEGGGFLIGPEEERWDAVMLVRQQNVETFLAFASNTGHTLAGHFLAYWRRHHGGTLLGALRSDVMTEGNRDGSGWR